MKEGAMRQLRPALLALHSIMYLSYVWSIGDFSLSQWC